MGDCSPVSGWEAGDRGLTGFAPDVDEALLTLTGYFPYILSCFFFL